MTEEIRDALRSLATDESAAPTATVDEATEALEDVRTLAAFVDDDGPERLRRAVAAAERDGDTVTARRGRRTLAAIDRCRTAAAEHFHSGHGTVLSADDQPPER
ncbi:hypothetical protein ACOZ4L_04210 [Haloplanus ruber]|uniref:Uncharacterized protein n=1 Tax=Haloplanus ruber TaxID=869892 RepID=A0ABD6D3K3_9EURY|nr:hypothetical protein [Haloplanus ruber]